jgi:hypothetical protein
MAALDIGRLLHSIVLFVYLILPLLSAGQFDKDQRIGIPPPVVVDCRGSRIDQTNVI